MYLAATFIFISIRLTFIIPLKFAPLLRLENFTMVPLMDAGGVPVLLVVIYKYINKSDFCIYFFEDGSIMASTQE